MRRLSQCIGVTDDQKSIIWFVFDPESNFDPAEFPLMQDTISSINMTWLIMQHNTGDTESDAVKTLDGV